LAADATSVSSCVAGIWEHRFDIDDRRSIDRF
jgi:hypothetical protein